MNDKFDNQDLEKFFHDNLDQYGEEPGEEFWTELEPMIPPPPKKRRRGLLLWWFLGGFFMVAIAAYVWSNQQNLSELEKQMLSQQQEIKALKTKKEKENIVEAVSPLKEKKSAELKEPIIESKPNKTSSIKPDNTAQTFKDFYALSTKPDSSISGNPSTNREGQVAAKGVVKKETPTEILKIKKSVLLRERLFWDTFDLLATKRDSLVAREKTENPRLVPPIITPEWEPRIGLGAFYESWVLISGAVSSSDENFREFSGRSFGVNFQLPLAKKWELETGLGLAKFTTSSSTKTTLEIDLARAVERPGDVLFNNYFYNIESFLGRTYYETGISYRLAENSANDPMEGDLFSILVNENIALDYLYLPLHLNYLLQKGKWGAKIGLGIDSYHLFKVDLKSSATSSLQDGANLVVEDIVASEDVRLVGLRNIFLGARASLGANYSFANNWKVNLDAGYHKGIRNIAVHDISRRFPEGANVKINYLSLRLGINYQF